MGHIAADPAADPALAREPGVELVPLEEVFRQGDFVTVNCPLLPATRHLVDARRIALTKPSAYLVNPMPPMPDDPVLALDSVILAPHALY